MDLTYCGCGCSLALSHPPCPSACHVPSAAPAGDILSNCQHSPMCYSLSYCMFLWIIPSVYTVYPNCECALPLVLYPASRPSSLHSNRTTSSNNNSHLTSPLVGKGMLLLPLTSPSCYSSSIASLLSFMSSLLCFFHFGLQFIVTSTFIKCLVY